VTFRDRSAAARKRIIAWFDFDGCVPHAQVLDSMELLSEAILPEWRARSA
jgi:hypothetical protein